MKKFILSVILISMTNFSFAQSNPTISPYVTFLNSETTSAKEYILNLFNTHDIVVICERDHRELTQYDLFLDIIRDKRFIDKAGNVFTELGVSNLNPELNIFLHTKNIPEQEQKSQILTFHRNMDPTVMWEKYSYTYLLQNLYNLNDHLPKGDGINLYPSNIPLDWSKMDSTNYKQTVLPLLRNRDSIIAAQIMKQFDEINHSSTKHKKALVILNYRHAFNKDFIVNGRKVNNVTSYLFKRYGDKVANVYLYGLGADDKGNQPLLQNGKWDAAFKITGDKSIGFNLANTPFGKDSFDLWVFKNQYRYQDIFTGFIFYQPIEDQKLVTGIPGFLDSAFFDEFFRRYQLSGLVYPNIKHFSQEEIANFKKDPGELQKELNTKRESSYPEVDSLVKIRDQWIK